MGIWGTVILIILSPVILLTAFISLLLIYGIIALPVEMARQKGGRHGTADGSEGIQRCDNW